VTSSGVDPVEAIRAFLYAYEARYGPNATKDAQHVYAGALADLYRAVDMIPFALDQRPTTEDTPPL
jgi:hypothetical protein